LVIRGVTLVGPAAAGAYTVRELVVELSATYDNPFDPGQIDCRG